MFLGFIADLDHGVTLRESYLEGKNNLEKLAYNLKMAHAFSTKAKFSEKLTFLTP